LKKLKKFDLLQIKEKLKMQKSISDLRNIEADSEKCHKIENELQNLLADYNSKVDKIGVNSFISNRYLMHKMLDQKAVMLNRLEFLENEKSILLDEMTKSKVKKDVLKKKQAELNSKLRNEIVTKNENSFSSIRKDR
tara:strand:- start:1418 stop:1828 length:411 start_codon:yes stop_codon:yes gene_type:complete